MEIIGGGTPKTSKPEYWNGDICWLSVKDFNNDNRYVYKTEKTITKEGLNNSSTKLLNRNDTIISARGTVGEIAMIPFPMAFNQSCYGLRAKEEIVDAEYLYYLIKYNVIALKKNTHGSVFDTITRDTFDGVEVNLPSMYEQEKIASILSVLDDKIENNSKINDNLEEQARALFYSMFIASEDRFYWHNGTFSDLIDSTLGGDWGKDAPSGKNTEMVYCIRGADIPDVRAGNKGKMPTRFILPKNFAAKRLLPDDIVVEISGGSPTQSTGRVAAISQALLDRYDKGVVCTNFCRALKPKSGYSKFVYYYWQYLYDCNVFFAYENGTTGIKNLDLSGFLTTEEIVIPPIELIQRFNDYCQSVFEQTFANGLENEKLATIRDTLLPRLMSGEIDVSNIKL